MTVFNTVWFFFLYGLLGWVIDTSYRSVFAGHFAPRSATGLPFTAIYGFGALLILFLSRWFKERSLWMQFVVYALAATVLEYIGALFSIHILGQQLWDYSSLAYNFDGHISLFHSIFWGVLGVVLVHWIHPSLKRVDFVVKS